MYKYLILLFIAFFIGCDSGTESTGVETEEEEVKSIACELISTCYDLEIDYEYIKYCLERIDIDQAICYYEADGCGLQISQECGELD